MTESACGLQPRLQAAGRTSSIRRIDGFYALLVQPTRNRRDLPEARSLEVALQDD
jgi:hypothetical protein